MFLDKTSNKIKGYIKINVCGFFTERFLNLTLVQNIDLWDIEKSKSDVIACANIYDYKKLVAIAKKTGCKIDIIEKVGVPFFIEKHKKRKIFLLAFIAMIICVYLCSLHIWNVKIIGDFTFPIDVIRHELEEENIKVGALKKNLDITKIKNNIYMQRHDIAWIGISFKGTTAIVEIVEGNLKEENELDKIPCDIVAAKDGMIYKIDVLEGNVLIHEGDIISKGQKLVSGMLDSDTGEIRYVSSKGSILARTWHTEKMKIPYEIDIVSETGNDEKSYCIKIKNNEINLLKTSTNFEKYDKILTESKLNLFGKFDLPITLQTLVYKELEIDTLKYTKEQAMSKAEKILKNKISKAIKDVYEVVEIKTDSYDCEDGIIYSVTVECIEEIGIKQKMGGL